MNMCRIPVAVALALAPAGVALAGPMAYLHTVGPAGDPATHLGWGLAIISIVVVVIIALLLLGAVFRTRPARPRDDARLAVDHDGGGMGWIYIGVGISAVVLFFSMGWTLVTTAAVMRPPSKPALTVQVTATQWWWEVRYASEDPSRTFTTANEIHIPVGQPVRFELSSNDVIHSFWVPRIGGKTDVIPGQTNVTWLQANVPGVYRGQCSVFCGAEHARMGFEVVAQSAKAFRDWQDNQLRTAPSPTTVDARAGKSVFQAHCAVCHAVRGTEAGGILGPDLSHLMSRRTLAANLLDNTPGNLAGWVADPQSLKPGTKMPNHIVSGRELADVLAYLHTLH